MNSCRVNESTVYVDLGFALLLNKMPWLVTMIESYLKVNASSVVLVALSGGFIDCCPSEVLVDSGAIASLLHERVLRWVGRADEPLRTYRGSLDSVSGHSIQVRGMIDLPVTLGSVEKTLPFVVVNHLHVDAILGTDTLRAFKAVIDLEEQALILKGSAEVVPLGDSHVEECYGSDIATTVKLAPGRQALVKWILMLIVSIADGDDSLRVARTLCTVLEGQLVVEICNTSTEELVITKDSQIAVAAVVPETAFQGQQGEPGKLTTGTYVISAARLAVEGDDVGQKQKAMDEHPSDEMKLEFHDTDMDEKQCELFATMLREFNDLFVETSKRPGRRDLLKFKIDMGTHAPIKSQSYRVSKVEGDVMEAELGQYLDFGLIKLSVSPWASPVLMIRKPDGGVRFCIDYRKLNAVTIKDIYPMHLIDDILDVLGKAKLFSTMDIASGYWNVPMDPESIEKTAFTSKFGLYEWLVMPFGLCNAVPAFERLMENVLVDLKWRTCLVYLDDCVVFSDDFPTHLVQVRQVLERFRVAGFKLKMKKCHWGRNQVAFLGHIATPSGILPNPEKVKAVMNVARPHDLHPGSCVPWFDQLLSTLYSWGFATIAAPLERLKEKGTVFRWNEDCEVAFYQLQRSLVRPPILAYPEFSTRFKLYVDSSHLAVGACLMQEVDGRDRAVAFA
ncbi:LOW QUALITY PROTEIN: hypothetical protein PHMEG_00021088, partial [Phytophthora megakarya]